MVLDFQSQSRVRYTANMAQKQTSVHALAALLADSCKDYLCVSPLPASVVHLRFLGRFQDRPVVWDATIHALGLPHEDRGTQNAAALRIPTARSFIDIAPAGGETFRLTVGLNLDLIDEPVIRKTIIMIRNYKRLRLGRMEWG